MSRVILVRHGHFDLETGELDEVGKQQVECLAMMLRSQVVFPVVILSSPITRAKETAELLQKSLLTAHIRFLDVLAAGSESAYVSWDDYEAVDAVIEEAAHRTVIIVTHAPLICQYIQWVFLNKHGSESDPVHLSYAEAVVVDEDSIIRTIKLKLQEIPA